MAKYIAHLLPHFALMVDQGRDSIHLATKANAEKVKSTNKGPSVATLSLELDLILKNYTYLSPRCLISQTPIEALTRIRDYSVHTIDHTIYQPQRSDVTDPLGRSIGPSPWRSEAYPPPTLRYIVHHPYCSSNTRSSSSITECLLVQASG